MQVTYQAETHKWQGNGGDFLITNLNPVQYQEEKAAARQRIEQQLYDVFCKYEPHKT
ncbi:MAG TPA: hypothetical protein IAC82_11730 [Candidatus Merdivicinus intestinigallinarum]|nr:hypothetical protein [Candidatus Merdivicinus intestinigallinarum]